MDAPADVTPRRYLFALTDGGGTVPPELGVARRLVASGDDVRYLLAVQKRQPLLTWYGVRAVLDTVTDKRVGRNGFGHAARQARHGVDAVNVLAARRLVV